jgi:hypothetical protein
MGFAPDNLPDPNAMSCYMSCYMRSYMMLVAAGVERRPFLGTSDAPRCVLPPSLRSKMKKKNT